MIPISPVLPHRPELPEIILAKDQPQYTPLPIVRVVYGDGTISVISRYRLSLRERLRLLFSGSIWWEQMTFGAALQPQLPHTQEPLAEPDGKT
jgi:hypothetical protein